MGKRLSISQPTVIQTELVPLSDSILLELDGAAEQWYYENTNVFSPDRQIIPLTISPKITAYDEDTRVTYNITPYRTTWKVMSWNGTAYVEQTIENTTDSFSQPYVIVGHTLKVHKNNQDATHGIRIECTIEFKDPRDEGIVYTAVEQVLLTTNKDATIMYPSIDILAPDAQGFNPLKDSDPMFTLEATSDWHDVPEASENLGVFYADPLGCEGILPKNVSDVITTAPFLDIVYGEGSGSTLKENQQFFFRQISNGTLPTIPNNMAFLQGVKGNTVKFNQMVQNGNFQSSSKWSVESYLTPYVTFNNGVIFNNVPTNPQYAKVLQSISFVSGHKYYLSSHATITDGAVTIVTIISGGYNRSYDLSPTTNEIKRIFTADNELGIGLMPALSIQTSGKVSNLMLLDLTDMGIDDLQTVADVELWLASNLGKKDYYPFTNTKLVPTLLASIESNGFNQWDEDINGSQFIGNYYINSAEQNYVKAANNNYYCYRIPVLPNTTYHLVTSAATLSTVCIRRFVDDDFNLIEGTGNGYSAKSDTFTTPANCSYMEIAKYKQSTANYNLNISDATRNGTYEPYKKVTCQVDVPTLKGKKDGVGSSVVIFGSNGMNGFNDLYDLLYVQDGVRKARKKFGVVDLGTLEWSINYAQASPYCFVSEEITNLKYSIDTTKKSNILCGMYTTRPFSETVNNTYDKAFATRADSPKFEINDRNYSNATAFRTAMNGVLAIFELATPEEYVLDPLPRGMYEWYGIENNQEVLIETLPCYQKAQQVANGGQHTSKITLNAMYSENIVVVLRVKEYQWSTEVLPPKVYRSIVWKIAPIDAIVVSENGSAVRSDSGDFTFHTLVNTLGEALSDEKKLAHLLFNWKWRNVNLSISTSVVNNLGWGQKVKLGKEDMLHQVSNGVLATTSIISEVYLLGAYEKVQENGEVVTYGGEEVFARIGVEQ